MRRSRRPEGLVGAAFGAAALVTAVLFPGCSADRGIPLAGLPPIDGEVVMAHTVELASDRYAGRAPGSAGEDLTVSYLETQFRAMGLAPGAPDGAYVQRVPLVGIASKPAPLVVSGPRGQLFLAFRDEIVATTRRVVDRAMLEGSEMVFVGYGVVAPEYGWDDYKGLDVAGKTLVMLVNDPPVRSATHPSGLDPAMFGGPAMTYYGRWTYKYEIASAKGAAGVFLVHETETAGYPFEVVQSGWTGEQFDLLSADRNMGRVAVEGWLSVDAARKLLAFAGHDLDALRRASATSDFRPVPLGVQARMTLDNTLRRVESRNVIARLEGSDPVLSSEAVIYMAHWDHLGTGEPDDTGDDIYNGARDNAVGVAGMLEVARAFTRLQTPPRRSVLFAAVTAEEQGLLGSRYYSENPTVPMSKTAAAINIDTLNVHGPTSDLTIIGLGASDLDAYATAALAEQGRTARPDPNPETGLYFRSDHFSFAKAGVPALYPVGGITYVNGTEEFGKRVQREYAEAIYHRAADEVAPEWNLAGAVQDLQILFAVGYRVADADRLPEWAPASEFRAIREASLAADSDREKRNR